MINRYFHIITGYIIELNILTGKYYHYCGGDEFGYSEEEIKSDNNWKIWK